MLNLETTEINLLSHALGAYISRCRVATEDILMSGRTANDQEYIRLSDNLRAAVVIWNKCSAAKPNEFRTIDLPTLDCELIKKIAQIGC